MRTRVRRHGIARSAITTFLAVVFYGSLAVAAEAPTVRLQVNGPGWITIYYDHSDPDGVIEYFIQREDTNERRTVSSPNGQFTDTNLTPSTRYGYRACAVYEGEAVPVCSQYEYDTTQPPPSGPTVMNPPTVTHLEVTTDSVTVSWGATGEYSKILVRIEDDLGNHDQRTVRNDPNRAYTFPGLRPGARYSVLLKGCSTTLLGLSCGPWSPVAVATTTSIAPPPPPPEMTVESSSHGLRYRNPVLAGMADERRRLDFCLRWGADCGQPAADAFCLLMNGAMPFASSFEPLNDVGSTTIIGTSEHCDQPDCDSFAFITCSAPRNDSVVVRDPALSDPAVVTAPAAEVVVRDPALSDAAVVTAPIAVGEEHVPAPSSVVAGGSASPDCASGFVWRLARPDDLICVTPQARARTALENQVAARFVDPAGAYGPNTCLSGYVWREAFEGDLVCVSPDVRALVREENRLGPSRRAR